MSTTTTAVSSTATACTPSWEIPIKDVACAAPVQEKTDAFDKCCKSAPIEKYNDGCNMYCLALGQSQHDLSSCLTKNGIRDGQVFCNTGNATASATSSPTSTRETSSSTSTSTSTSSSTSSGSGASETSEGAAVMNQPVSKGGLGLLAMMFCSALLGVVA
ncbi:hypothetical protein PHISCL_07486 [Aspergillus sclerotialis]|uniref:Uncharacterized protein n=1 Tax=Aspergillus sclerotialis TaxID=2070753 RepID=A0A3A2ZAL4_9EURO|nr:hypothetical protein PHISCL_07486 [Aspergillus sclerotialis]